MARNGTKLPAATPIQRTTLAEFAFEQIISMRYRLYLKLMIPHVPDRVWEQHKIIHDAICRRDADAARAAMFEHLESTVRLVSHVVEQHGVAEV